MLYPVCLLLGTIQVKAQLRVGDAGLARFDASRQ